MLNNRPKTKNRLAISIFITIFCTVLSRITLARIVIPDTMKWVIIIGTIFVSFALSLKLIDYFLPKLKHSAANNMKKSIPRAILLNFLLIAQISFILIYMIYIDILTTPFQTYKSCGVGDSIVDGTLLQKYKIGDKQKNRPYSPSPPWHAVEFIKSCPEIYKKERPYWWTPQLHKHKNVQLYRGSLGSVIIYMLYDPEEKVVYVKECEF